MGGEGGEKLGEGVKGDPSRRQRERDEAEALRMREIPSPSAPSLSTSPPPFAEPFQPPSVFPSLPLWRWLRRCWLRAAPDAGAWGRH